MSNKRPIFALVLLLVGLLWSARPGTPPVAAQIQHGWSPPYQLSTDGRKATEAALVADQFGFVHAFWAETMDNNRDILQYARFDGTAWTAPVDLFVGNPFQPVKSISPVVDEQGTLHLMWISGQSGPFRYAYAPAHDALAAPKWTHVPAILQQGSQLGLSVGPDGSLRLLFQVTESGSSTPAGLYSMVSTDGANNWSAPVWIDPDIPPGMVPRLFSWDQDADGIVHVAWYYIDLSVSNAGDWVRYTRSTDGGLTWDTPRTIAKNTTESAPLNPFAGVVLAASGREVHIVYAAGEFLYRHHTYSTDNGETWTVPRRFMGNLNGQAWDGLTVDGAGNVHFVGQIRFPMAIYHSAFVNGTWTTPETVYMLRINEAAPPNPELVQAHHTHPIIRAGNHLVITFADPPPQADRRLVVTERLLGEVGALEPQPTPTPVPLPSPTATTPPAEPTPEPTRQRIAAGPVLPAGGASNPADAIWMALLPVALILGLVFAVKLVGIGRR